MIILGPPGAGKGTQSKAVAEKIGIAHVDCGHVIRDEVSGKTAFGSKAEEYIVSGKLVPDELIIGMILHRLSYPDCGSGYLLDGFPRTLEQARRLDEFLAGQRKNLDYVLSIELDEDAAVKRLSSRRYCQACGSVFNLLTVPPKEGGMCDNCGGKLMKRLDDKPDTIKERFKIYKAETEPVKEYYKDTVGYFEVDGNKASDVLTEEIVKAIREGGRCG